MENTIENNRLIAEFMGAESQADIIDSDVLEYDMFGCIGMANTFQDINAKHFYHPEEMRFHDSWDWLMPVVEKIESIEDENRCAKYNVNVFQCFVDIVYSNNNEGEEIVVVDGQSRRDAIYKAVVKFIEWYNNQHKIK